MASRRVQELLPIIHEASELGIGYAAGLTSVGFDLVAV